ncbi:phage terminase large subunit-like protein [Variovorax sp. OAS795]|uniref:terminase large subunit n=1 Tax=Variovorax sp. OAS795 TaxID=3034231 RepID=UPI003395BBF1
MPTPTKSSSPPADHAGKAQWYAESVLNGTVPAGHWVRQAAKRHLDDLKKSKAKAYPFKFEADKGAKVCRFIEKLPHTKGKWAAKKEVIRLQPWQCFLVVVGFGWLRKKNGKRRFRTFYWEIPRKNGKSLLAGGIGNYMFTADGEFGAEVYSGATTEKQAWEVFGPARLMMKRNEGLASHMGVEVMAKGMVVLSNGSKFEPVIGNPGDGASPSCAIVDEYHEHDTPTLYDTMETGMGAREQPLILAITTAGANIAGPCHEKHDEVCKVLDGIQEDDELFGVIFGIDKEDDWADPKSLIKANPNYGVSVDADFLLAQQRRALQNPLQQNKFKTKHLNVWTSVFAGVMNMQQWALCADPLLDEEELKGCDSWVAVDLASKSDLCAEQRLYRRDSHGKAHYYLFGSYWLPEEAVEEPGPNAAHYAKWVKQGLLIQTDGATVDFEQITEQVIEDCKRINPREAIFDPFNAVQMMQALMAKNIEAVEFIQTPANFAVPLDELLTAVKDGRFHHDGNAMTTWCMSNMVARPAKKGLVSPIKQKPHQKIDGAVAAIMAMARACAEEPTQEPSIRWL